MDRELRTEPEWWHDWWSRFQSEQWRNIRRAIYVLAVAVAISLLVSLVNLVQAENTRDQQARTLRALERIEALETEIAADAGAVADYVAEIQARPSGGGDPRLARAFEAIERSNELVLRIAIWIEQFSGEPLPPAPTTTLPSTTTTAPGQ
jgi:hypothetical protein